MTILLFTKRMSSRDIYKFLLIRTWQSLCLDPPDMGPEILLLFHTMSVSSESLGHRNGKREGFHMNKAFREPVL